MRHPARLAVSLCLATALLASCGDDGDTGPDLRNASTTTAPAAASTDVTSTVVTGTTPTSEPASTGPGTTTAGTGTPTLSDRSSVSTTGFDTIVFGMTLAQAESAAGTKLVPAPAFSGGPGCSVVVPESGPAGVSFTVTKGTVERVDIRPPATVGTRSGARIGSTVTQLQSLYGDRLTAAASGVYVYTPRDAADAAFRVVFTTDGATVTTYRAGRVPQVESTDPC